MFVTNLQSNLAGRSRAVLAAARSLLNVEHDNHVDWEVDEEPATLATHPHRERLRPTWRAQERRRGGALPAPPQVCLSPLPSSDGHRHATPSMQRAARTQGADARRSTPCS